MMQKITPFLWFDGNAEEAVNFYTTTFKNSKILSISRYPEQMPEMAGKVLTAVFELDGQQFMAIDGGPQFKFTEAISLYVDCKDQEEIDYFRNTLISNGGEESQCGRLKDKYGLSRQIVPPILGELLNDPDREKAGRVLQAMLAMKKIDIQALKKAYEG